LLFGDCSSVVARLSFCVGAWSSFVGSSRLGAAHHRRIHSAVQPSPTRNDPDLRGAKNSHGAAVATDGEEGREATGWEERPESQTLKSAK
jgi:hypothetical protein